MLNIFYSAQRIVFKQHKMSLNLSNTLSLPQFLHFVREIFCPSGGLVRIKASVHFMKLTLGSEAYFLFDVHSARPYESWVESVKVIGRHEDEALFRRCHAI